MDAFYASIEQRDNPSLKGKAIAVGGDGNRGVVASASYEARRFGVRSAMSAIKAKKLCPHLIFVPGRMQVYKEESATIHSIFYEYTDLVESIGYDEAFLDVTENKSNLDLAVDIAKEIKFKIKKQINLVASAGVSYNKFLAKIASDYRKPDGLCTIHPDVALSFIEKLPIESFWGIGKVTSQRMHSLGIHNGLDLRNYPLNDLLSIFGKAGLLYHHFSNGIDNRRVEASRIRKSVGCESTFFEDLIGKDIVWNAIETEILPELIERLSRTGFEGKTLTLKVKFSDFTQRTISRSRPFILTTEEQIKSLVEFIFAQLNLTNEKIRLLGLSVSNPLLLGEDGQLYLDFQD
jgi:DNA polymerase-4